MSISKPFVIKNGLEVNTNLIVADVDTGRVGIATTIPLYTLHINGGIGVTDLYVSGISTFGSDVDISNDLNVSGVSTFASDLDINASVDISNDLNVSGVSTFIGIGTFVNDLSVGGDLNVSGFSTFGGDLNVSGISTFASDLDINASVDISNDLNVSGVSTFASDLDINASVDISNDLNVAGVSTFASDLDINASIDVDGHTELDDLNVSGISTFASDLDINASVDISNDLNVSGVSTFASNVDINASVDISNDLNVAGVSTFIGGITGTISTATQLETPRTFEITGDVVASPIAFDGTGNVSLAATIQPNSVGLGTDTFGNYVKNISGTANEIVVTGGTGEGSTPVISIDPNPTLGGNVVVGNDLQINNNLNVIGNITIGGTTGYILVDEFRVKDKDIVLGFTTDLSGNDVSNDTTANGGGVAIASTEGSPLVCLQCAGINTFPGTYKQLIWFKSGAFSGLNTDAWLTNYAIGIGSTQVPNDVRLAAGAVQFTDNDIVQVRNINASGIITTYNFNISNNLNVSGISTFSSDLDINASIDVDGHTELDNLNVSGVSTFVGVGTFNGDLYVGGDLYVLDDIFYDEIGGRNINISGISTLGTVKISSGIVTASSGIVTYYGDGQYLQNILSGVGVATAGGTVGTGATILDFRGAGISTVTVTSGIATINITGEGGTVFNDTTTNQEFYLTFTDITSGTLTSTRISTSKLTYNPFSGEVTAVDYNSTSDQSLKTNIQTVDHALDIVSNLRGVSFDWKQTGKPSYGIIAQELEQVLPNLVGNGDIKTVNYNGIIGVLIEAIKELKNEIEDLKSINRNERPSN